RLEAVETEAKLGRALERLEPELREALLLHAVAGLKYREIAEATGSPIGTVTTRIHAARERLDGLLRGWRKEKKAPPRRARWGGQGRRESSGSARGSSRRRSSSSSSGSWAAARATGAARASWPQAAPSLRLRPRLCPRRARRLYPRRGRARRSSSRTIRRRLR